MGFYNPPTGGGGSGGTVTSVGLSLPVAVFTVSGSPVTSAGTLTAVFANQTQGTVFAGSASGGSIAPTFRALVGTDLPFPTTSTLGGVKSAVAVSHQWISAITTAGGITQSQPAFTDISGTASAGQLPIATTSTIGAVKVDGTSITITSAGSISATSGGSGTVTTVSVVTAAGISGTVANATTTPAITLAVATQSAGDNTTNAATTAFVTTAIANAIAGSNPAIAVQAATTSAGNTSALTYNNGVSGVGATFTGANNTALTVDGYTFTALGQRLLVKNDTQSPSGAFNGIYYVTQVQALALPLILTRALDYDTPSDMNNTGAIPVVNGTVNGQTSWVLTSQIATVGTDPLTFTQFTLNPTTLVVGPASATDGNFAYFSGSTGKLIKNGGTPAASATTDTTNAANISSGTLPAGRLPIATSSGTIGAVSVDGSTITITSAGAISASGGGGGGYSQVGTYAVPSSGAVATISFTSLSANNIIVFVNGLLIDNTGGGTDAMSLAVSTNNGSSYGSTVNLTAATALNSGGARYGTLFLSGTKVGLINYNNYGLFTNSSPGVSARGSSATQIFAGFFVVNSAVNALQFSCPSGSLFLSGTLTLLGN